MCQLPDGAASSALFHAPMQVDQIGQQECAQPFAYLVRNVPGQGTAAASEDTAFLRSLPIFPAMLPGRRMSLDSSEPAPAFCPPDVIAATAGCLSELPEGLQVRALGAPHCTHACCPASVEAGEDVECFLQTMRYLSSTAVIGAFARIRPMASCIYCVAVAHQMAVVVSVAPNVAIKTMVRRIYL